MLEKKSANSCSFISVIKRLLKEEYFSFFLLHNTASYPIALTTGPYHRRMGRGPYLTAASSDMLPKFVDFHGKKCRFRGTRTLLKGLNSGRDYWPIIPEKHFNTLGNVCRYGCEVHRRPNNSIRPVGT